MKPLRPVPLVPEPGYPALAEALREKRMLLQGSKNASGLPPSRRRGLPACVRLALGLAAVGASGALVGCARDADQPAAHEGTGGGPQPPVDYSDSAGLGGAGELWDYGVGGATLPPEEFGGTGGIGGTGEPWDYGVGGVAPPPPQDYALAGGGNSGEPWDYGVGGVAPPADAGPDLDGLWDATAADATAADAAVVQRDAAPEPFPDASVVPRDAAPEPFPDATGGIPDAAPAFRFRCPAEGYFTVDLPSGERAEIALDAFTYDAEVADLLQAEPVAVGEVAWAAFPDTDCPELLAPGGPPLALVGAVETGVESWVSERLGRAVSLDVGLLVGACGPGAGP